MIRQPSVNLSNRTQIARKTFCLAVLTAVGFLTLPVSQYASAEKAGKAESGKEHLADAPMNCRVTWTADPTTQARLSWNTTTAGQSHRVLFSRHSEEPAADDSSQSAPAEISGKYTDVSGKIDFYYHHAELTDLQPGTRYDVVFESDGVPSSKMYFITAPEGDKPFSLLFGGDSRSGHKDRRQVNAMMARMAAEQTAAGRPPILALMHGGDYVRDGRRLDLWSVIMNDYDLSTGTDGRLLPIIPTRGNHDTGPLFNEIFGFPVGNKNYYGISFSSMLRVVTLNTETSSAGEQKKWLAKELETNRTAHRWVVPQYHRPAFPAVKVPSGAYVSWVPLFEKHNVPLVCEADGHCIKRTAPIRGQRIDPTGVVYIGEGGLGVGQRSPKGDRWFLNSPLAKIGQGHHVHMLTFSKSEINGKVIRLDGTLFDEFHIF